MMTGLHLYWYLFSAMAAMVPSTVLTTVLTTAMNRLFIKASSTRRFWNSVLYQSSVKPVHTALMRDSLKEYSARINSGRYKNASITSE